MPRARKKNTTPARPAPQSNLPGRLAQRSDTNVPSRLPFNAEQHGDRQAFAAQQSAGGPGPSAPTGAPGSAPTPSAPGAPLPQLPDVFAPSTRNEAEPVSMVMDSRGQLSADDPDLYLHVLYSEFPDPDILRLIQRRRGLDG